jgi:hypothetical protein
MPWMNCPSCRRVRALVDLRAAAVHDHRVHADQLQQHHVVREALLQLLVGHRVAAVLDDDRLAVEAADVGQRLGQDVGLPALEAIERHGYIPHVKGRGQEASELKRNSAKKARRWVVEVAHSWFNRFRKLLVRYEKLNRSFIALNHLAAAIIAFRKVKLPVNIIYG